MKITVVVTMWQAPFEQMIAEIKEFLYTDDNWNEAKDEALAYINDFGKRWWDEAGGDRCLAEKGKNMNGDPLQPWEPIVDLGFQWAQWSLWGGESGFHAFLDAKSWWKCHEDYYKREFDDKGQSRPGYLRNAYGEDTTAERQAVVDFYKGH